MKEMIISLKHRCSRYESRNAPNCHFRDLPISSFIPQCVLVLDELLEPGTKRASSILEWDTSSSPDGSMVSRALILDLLEFNQNRKEWSIRANDCFVWIPHEPVDAARELRTLESKPGSTTLQIVDHIHVSSPIVIYRLAPEKGSETIEIGFFEPTVETEEQRRRIDHTEVHNVAHDAITNRCRRWLAIWPPRCSLPDFLREFRRPFD